MNRDRAFRRSDHRGGNGRSPTAARRAIDGLEQTIQVFAAAHVLESGASLELPREPSSHQEPPGQSTGRLAGRGAAGGAGKGGIAALGRRPRRGCPGGGHSDRRNRLARNPSIALMASSSAAMVARLAGGALREAPCRSTSRGSWNRSAIVVDPTLDRAPPAQHRSGESARSRLEVDPLGLRAEGTDRREDVAVVGPGHGDPLQAQAELGEHRRARGRARAAARSLRRPASPARIAWTARARPRASARRMARSRLPLSGCRDPARGCIAAGPRAGGGRSPPWPGSWPGGSTAARGALPGNDAHGRANPLEGRFQVG